jgi:hypothetical protein
MGKYLYISWRTLFLEVASVVVAKGFDLVW